MTKLFSQQAPYLFDKTAEEESEEERIRNFGQWILEGSKPGSAAAAVYVTHRVLPLNNANYGRIAAQAIATAEYFWKHFDALKKALASRVNLVMPFEPDCNLVAFTLNPKGNHSLDTLNQFARRLYEKLKPETQRPVQVNEFIGSHTLMLRDQMHPDLAAKLRRELESHAFTEDASDADTHASSLFIFRHTLMNPWLLKETDGKNYIDRYFEFLHRVVLEELEAISSLST